MTSTFGGLVADLRAERQRAADELARVDAALAALQGGRAAPARHNSLRPSSHATAIAALLRRNPGQEYDGVRVYAELLTSGWSTPADDPIGLIRTTLGMLCRTGRITRVRPGIYVG